MSYDLTIMSAPGTVLSSTERQRVLNEFVAETALNGPCELTVLDLEADALDYTTLQQCFEQGELSREEFKAFCSVRHIPLRAGDQGAYEAARLFLDEKTGQGLFSLGLPRDDDEVREAYRLIVRFARARGLVVDDPQVGEHVDLDNPGEFPAMWEPKKPQQRIRGWFFGIWQI
jgi:hypothetical protein